jgi:hypothetical protein
MSALRAILDRLSDIEATITQIEGSATPEDARAYQLTLKSLEKRRDTLRDELTEITNREFIEICDYRIIPEGPISYAITAVTTALRDFQDLVTLIFDSDPKKPKQRARVDLASTEKTRFDFGFAYAGSLGVVLTVPNERLIGVESDLDLAIREAFNLMSAKTNSDIRKAATQFGPPVVRKLYSWSKTQRDFDLSADIKWKRGDEVRTEVLVQAKESAEVCRLIENKSDTTEERINVVANLVGFNVATRRFTLEMPDGELVPGSFDKAFDVSPRVVPGRYQARLVKRTTIHYVIEKDEISWILEGLAEIQSD